ncbi:ATP-dependent RecD-like DNA helicase, partial [Methylobacterium sp. J-030]|nr:ATP-dependent RecD-like DNA helicase [Methylobacterium sp. J-030]
MQYVWGDKPCTHLAGLHAAARMIAERLLRRATGTPPCHEIALARALPWVHEETGKALSPSQSEAVRRVLGAKLAV